MSISFMTNWQFLFVSLSGRKNKSLKQKSKLFQMRIIKKFGGYILTGVICAIGGAMYAEQIKNLVAKAGVKL